MKNKIKHNTLISPWNYNTIAFGKDTELKRIAFSYPNAKRSMTQKEVGQSLQKEECLRSGILSKASGKKTQNINYQSFAKASASAKAESFNKLIDELPLYKKKWLCYNPQQRITFIAVG